MNPKNPLDWLKKGDRDLRVAKLTQAQSPDCPDMICYSRRRVVLNTAA